MTSLWVRSMRLQQYPGNIKIVEDLFGILAFLPPCLEFIPRCGDRFSTGETSNGYHFFNLSSYLLV